MGGVGQEDRIEVEAVHKEYGRWQGFFAPCQDRKEVEGWHHDLLYEVRIGGYGDNDAGEGVEHHEGVNEGGDRVPQFHP